MLDIKSLKYFVAVFEEGGFARASVSLHTVQSNVSARIIRLEKDLGVPLFERRRRGASATVHGVRLYHHAKRVLGMIDEIRREAQDGEEIRRSALERQALLKTEAARSTTP